MYTKGPWFLKNGNEIHDKETLFNKSGSRIGNTPNLIAIVDYFNTEANARLIASAPELLEALRELEQLVSAHIPEEADQWCKKAREIIAKAVGE
jgi:hypothetical protein